jgi:hypothetical protein
MLHLALRYTFRPGLTLPTQIEGWICLQMLIPLYYWSQNAFILNLTNQIYKGCPVSPVIHPHTVFRVLKFYFILQFANVIFVEWCIEAIVVYLWPNSLCFMYLLIIGLLSVIKMCIKNCYFTQFILLQWKVD